MKFLVSSIICVGFVCAGTQAWADDAMSSDASTTHHQMMKDCMAKQAAKNDGTSKADMKKACSDQMKMQSNQPGMNAPTDSPTADKKIGTGQTSNK